MSRHTLLGHLPDLVYFLISLDIVSAISTPEVGKREPELCSVAKERCASRVGCGMALQGFYISCQGISYGQSTECSPMCTRALVTLLLADDSDGLAFMNCDCAKRKFCTDRQKRIREMCKSPVLELLKSNNRTFDIGCNLANWVCAAEETCYSASNDWSTNCSSPQDVTSCNTACNSSLNALLRHAVGAKIVWCFCSEQPTVNQCQRLRSCYHTTSSGSSRNGQMLNLGIINVLISLVSLAVTSVFRELVLVAPG